MFRVNFFFTGGIFEWKVNLPPCFFSTGYHSRRNPSSTVFVCFSASPCLEIQPWHTVHQSDSTPSSHLYAVALKLPVFWPDSCESWFINAESQFHLKNFTSSLSKFHHVVASLPQKEIDNVVDIIRTPPAADPYGVLRSRLLQTHSLTDYACCESMSCHCCPG